MTRKRGCTDNPASLRAALNLGTGVTNSAPRTARERYFNRAGSYAPDTQTL